MSELPKGWTKATLGEIAIWGSGGTPSRSEPHYYGGGIPWVKTGELGPRLVTTTEETISETGLANSSAKIFPSGSVAIAMYGATIGKTSILGIPASTNQACAVGIPHPEITGNVYLYHFLCSQKEAFAEAGKGGAQPNISQAVIKGWPVPVAPLPEQKRIADKLDTVLARVDACRDRLDRLPALLKRFRQSILAAATSGRLTEEWRIKQNEPEPVQLTLRDVLKLSSGNFLPAKNMTPGGTVPVYGGNGVNGYHSQSNVSEESLLIGRVGYYCGSVHLTPPQAWVTDNALIVRHDPAITNRRFLFYALQAIDLRVNDSSTAQPVISGQKIYPLEITAPSMNDQLEIVRRVEILFAFADRLESRLSAARKQVDQLTPALLAKAFRGELVPQDPTDEPASELLKRLAAQRAVTPAAKRGRKAAAI